MNQRHTSFVDGIELFDNKYFAGGPESKQTNAPQATDLVEF